MALRKNLITIELFHQPNMHVVIAFIHHSLWCEFASTFNVLTLCGCNVSCCRNLTTSKWYVRVTISTLNFAVGVDGNPQPCYFRYFGFEVIVFTLLIHVIYLCYKSSSTVCVSIPIQEWHLSIETWPFEVGSLQHYHCSQYSLVLSLRCTPHHK